MLNTSNQDSDQEKDQWNIRIVGPASLSETLEEEAAKMQYYQRPRQFQMESNELQPASQYRNR